MSQVTPLAKRIQAMLAVDSLTPTLHAAALIELRSGHAARASLTHAIALLGEARRLAPHDVAILNDLSVAYVELADRDRDVTALLKALDIIDIALRADSALPSAYFNRALILARLSLLANADSAWARYLASDRDSRWASEASSLRHASARRADTLTAYQFPQQARDAAFRHLGEWGRATQNGRVIQADSLRQVMRGLADSLRVLGADGSVGLAIEWLDAFVASHDDRQTLARAFVDFAAGITLHDNAQAEAAVATLGLAQRALDALGSPTARWAAFYLAAAEVNLAHYAVADSSLRRVERRATAREPALVGKARWVRGVGEVRQGNYESGVALYRQAREYFVVAKDGKNLAAISYLLSEGLALAGQFAASSTEAFSALKSLAPFRQSYYLHNHLIAVASLARREGLRFAALDVVDEALIVNRTLDKADALVFALCAHARDLAALGDTTRAMADLAEATGAASRLGPHGQRRALVDIAFTRGRLVQHRAPREAAGLLASAVDGYRELGALVRMPTALYESGQMMRTASDDAGARRQFSEAIDVIEAQRATFATVEARSSFMETVENVFDAMMMLELDAARPDTAFAYLERERIAVWPAGRKVSSWTASVGPPSLTQIVAGLPSDALFVSYALLPDRLVIWSASRRGVAHHSVRASRDSLASLAVLFTRESSRGRSVTPSQESMLYAALIHPIRAELTGMRQLIIAPDRELAEVPFAALSNPQSGRRLIEDYSVRNAPSGAFVAEAAKLLRPALRGSSVLVVGDPQLSHEDAEWLPALRGAATEARNVAGIYSRSLVLAGEEARRAAVVGALPTHPVFHFAGHAVFNGDQPELSYLALSKDSATGSARLEAREIATLRLSNVQLVVLSACSTLRSRTSRSGPVLGLASSFLRAGVPATVSTLWDVSDDVTGELLVTFHRHVAHGVTPPEALRLSQLEAMRSAHSERRSSAGWAAFVYTGP